MSTPVVQADSVRLPVRAFLPDEGDDGRPLDLTGAALTFVFLSPSGVRTERAGAADGDPALGTAVYLTTDEDLDEVGSWQVQVRAEYADPARRYFSEVGRVRVARNI